MKLSSRPFSVWEFALAHGGWRAVATLDYQAIRLSEDVLRQGEASVLLNQGGINAGTTALKGFGRLSSPAGECIPSKHSIPISENSAPTSPKKMDDW